MSAAGPVATTLPPGVSPTTSPTSSTPRARPGGPRARMNTHRGIVNRLYWMQERYRSDAGGRRPAEDAVQLRRLGLGVLLAADVRRRRSSSPSPAATGTARTSPGDHRARASPRCTSCPRCSRLFLDEPGPGDCVQPAARHLQRRGAAHGRCRTRFFATARAPSCTTSTGRPRPPSTSPPGPATRAALPFVPIGRPDRQHADLRARRAACEPVPVGVRRRAATSAACRSAAGYLNRPELTAERFVPDPFSAARARGSTGPATWRATCPTGTSSSSAAATSRSRSAASASSSARSRPRSRPIDGVRGAVVVRARTLAGDKRARRLRRAPAVHGLPVDELRARLGERLPEYMVPTVVHRGSSASRSAPTARSTARPCRRPTRIRPQLETPYVAPRTPLSGSSPSAGAPLLDARPCRHPRPLLRAGRHLPARGALRQRACRPSWARSILRRHPVRRSLGRGVRRVPGAPVPGGGGATRCSAAPEPVALRRPRSGAGR